MVTAGYTDLYALRLTRPERLGALRAWGRIQEQSNKAQEARIEREKARREAREKSGTAGVHRPPVRSRGRVSDDA